MRFGGELKKMRENAAQTQLDLAKAVHVSQGHLSDVERGRKRATGDVVQRLDAALGAEGRLVRLWDELRDSEYASWFLDVLDVERQAEEIQEYQPLVIPGLLQTEDYARAQVDPGPEREARVKARLSRQEVLSKVRFLAVVEEHVLRRPVGGHRVLSAQLGHILGGEATVQVVPADATTHPGSDGPFVLYRDSTRDVVYVENRISGTARDDHTTTRSFNTILSELRGIAHPPDASRKVIEKIKEEIDAEHGF